MNIHNVILDWSGVTAEDFYAVWKSTNRLLIAYKRPAQSFDTFRHRFNALDVRLPSNAEQLLDSERLFVDEYHKHHETISLLPHAVEFLELCAKRDWKVFLVATMDARTFVRLSDRFGLNRYTVQPYLGVENKTSKVRRILKENSLTPAETLLVGDMEEDLKAGITAGVQTCAVLTGYDLESKLRVLQPDILCNDLRELRRILEKS